MARTQGSSKRGPALVRRAAFGLGCLFCVGVGCIESEYSGIGSVEGACDPAKTDCEASGASSASVGSSGFTGSGGFTGASSSGSSTGSGSSSSSSGAGGSVPQPNGQPCAFLNQGADCVSGHCMDGVCCNDPCTTRCYSCVVPGKVGFCSLLPAGGTEINPQGLCAVGDACDVNGQCTGLEPNEFNCSLNSQCASGQCAATAGTKKCKLAPGAACAMNGDCAANLCQQNLCVACTMDPQCSPGKCVNAECTP